MICYIEGDLLETEFPIICHQTNCTIIGAGKGLAKLIFNKYPYANTYNAYSNRVAGTADICCPKSLNKKNKIIVNLYGQHFVGQRESKLKREKWFAEALEDMHIQLSLISNLTYLAFPYRIGCGLAGGYWSKYEQMLIEFNVRHPEYTILIYKLNE